MAFFFGSSSFTGFDRCNGLIKSSTLAAGINSTYSLSALQLGPAAWVEKTLDSGQVNLWARCSAYENTTLVSNFDYPIITFGNRAVGDLFRILATNGVFQAQYWDGAAWQNVTGTQTILGNARHYWDLHVRMNNSGGEIEMYYDDSLIGSFSGDTILTAATTLDYVRYSSYYFTALAIYVHFSEMIIANESTIGAHAYQHTLTANGDTFDWTGNYLRLNQGSASLPDRTTQTESDTVGDIALCAVSDLPATALYMRGVCVNAEVRKGTSGPQAANLAIKTSGSVFHSADKVLSPAVSHISHIWATNPVSLIDWSDAQVDAVQAGIRART